MNHQAAAAPALRRPALDWRQIAVLYRREILGALREKSIILNSILIPVFLYPLLLWVVLSGLMFVTGQTDTFVSRVRVQGWPVEHPVLRHKLESDAHLKISPADPELGLPRLQEDVRAGRLDLLIEFVPPTNSAALLPGNFDLRLTFDQSKERSVAARDRVEDIVHAYRATWLKREARRLGVDAAAWQGFTIATRNLASRKEMGAFLLGMLAPVIFVVMVAMGCFYPAVDAIAGERERNTWETLMSCATSRANVLVAKYLYVTTFGGLAGMLNLLAVIVSLRPIFAPLLSRAGRVIEGHIPLAAIPAALIASVLLAGFIAAAMMIFASFARSFKEGQAMVTPFYMLVLVPVVFLQAPGLKFTPMLALVPIVNITLMVREAFSGQLPWLPTLLTIGVSLLAIALCLRLAVFVLRFENVFTGSFAGNLATFLGRRLPWRKNAANPPGASL